MIDARKRVRASGLAGRPGGAFLPLAIHVQYHSSARACTSNILRCSNLPICLSDPPRRSDFACEGRRSRGQAAHPQRRQSSIVAATSPPSSKQRVRPSVESVLGRMMADAVCAAVSRSTSGSATRRSRHPVQTRAIWRAAALPSEPAAERGAVSRDASWCRAAAVGRTCRGGSAEPAATATPAGRPKSCDVSE